MSFSLLNFLPCCSRKDDADDSYIFSRIGLTDDEKKSIVSVWDTHIAKDKTKHGVDIYTRFVLENQEYYDVFQNNPQERTPEALQTSAYVEMLLTKIMDELETMVHLAPKNIKQLNKRVQRLKDSHEGRGVNARAMKLFGSIFLDLLEVEFLIDRETPEYSSYKKFFEHIHKRFLDRMVRISAEERNYFPEEAFDDLE